MVEAADLIEAIDKVVSRIGFVRKAHPAVLACWVRRTLGGNRAIVVIEAPPDVDPAKFAREQRWLYAKAAGFLIPLFYEVGVQVVVLTGGTVKSNPQGAVDRLSNQWCMIQAIHVVELATGRLFSAASWGQSATALAQDAVSGALQHAISSRPVDPTGDVLGSGRVDRAGAPGWVVAVIAGAIVAVLIQILLRFVHAIGQPPS